MAADVENLVLKHLKALRGDVTEVGRELRDVKTRLSSVENQFAQLHKKRAGGYFVALTCPSNPSAGRFLSATNGHSRMTGIGRRGERTFFGVSSPAQ